MAKATFSWPDVPGKLGEVHHSQSRYGGDHGETMCLIDNVPSPDRQLAAELAARLRECCEWEADYRRINHLGNRPPHPFEWGAKLLARPDVQALLGTEPPATEPTWPEPPVTSVPAQLGKSYEREPFTIEPQPAPSPWIPVSERLPEKPGKYLSYGAGARPFVHVSTFGYSGFEGQPIKAGNAFPPTVSHWMPLPAPPEPQPKEQR